MSNFLEDSINFGFGLFAYSREKIEAIVEKLVEKGDLPKSDASNMVAKLVEKGNAEKEKIEEVVSAQVKKAVEKVTPLSREELREIIREEIKKAMDEKQA